MVKKMNSRITCLKNNANNLELTPSTTGCTKPEQADKGKKSWKNQKANMEQSIEVNEPTVYFIREHMRGLSY